MSRAVTRGTKLSARSETLTFYICILLVAAAGLLAREAEAAAQAEEPPGFDPRTTSSTTTALPTAGKKTYKSAYHHVSPGHSGFRYSSSTDPSDEVPLSPVKVAITAVLVVFVLVFVVVVCAYWGRRSVVEEHMSERQAAVTQFLKMNQQV